MWFGVCSSGVPYCSYKRQEKEGTQGRAGAKKLIYIKKKKKERKGKGGGAKGRQL
jgi:hypothetical protein